MMLEPRKYGEEMETTDEADSMTCNYRHQPRGMAIAALNTAIFPSAAPPPTETPAPMFRVMLE